MSFLPVTEKEMKERGWRQPDFVMVTGDAYVDHPSFGTAIISRLLERFCYNVCILAQPDWRSADDFRRFGKPRLGFLISSGSVDSMVNNYSVFKRRRKEDRYSPGGRAGMRPDRAVTVYCNRAREAYPGVPVIIGGLEASLRRLGHYDYWDDAVRRSVLIDSRADILIYGMGERAVIEIAEALDSGIEARDITWIRGTCVRSEEPVSGALMLPSFREIQNDREAYCRSFMMQYRNHDSINAVTLCEQYDRHLFVVQNPPQPPLEREELDDVYELPYERACHPMYEKQGGVPATDEVRFSIVSSRGCFGGCAFCAITFHQGRQVRSRSVDSIVREAGLLTKLPDFKGYIHDVGGPTANFRMPACRKQLGDGVCPDRDCLFPRPCPNMDVSHKEYLEVLRAVRAVPGVKKVFIRSGIRFDYVMADSDRTFLEELCRFHVSGTLKVAPEHVVPEVLSYMRKPDIRVFEEFCREYFAINRRIGKEQYLIPYLISSHPGCTLDDAVDLALYLKKTGFVPDQVQDFYPTPGTLATCMYYTEMDPMTMEPVYVAKTMKEKKYQRALMHFNKPYNRKTVEEALRAAGREDLKDVLLSGSSGHHRAGRGKPRRRRR